MEYLNKGNREHYEIPVDDNGIISLDILEKKLEKYAQYQVGVLVSIQMANSETGVIQPIKAISEIVHKFPNCYLHTDATQYIPYFDVNVEKMGIDMLSMSGQKLGGIKGSGLLYVREGINLTPILFGEQGLIGGTPSVPMIASLGKAFEIKHTDNAELYHKRKVLWRQLELLGAVLVGDKDQRLPNNLYVRFKGVRGDTLMHLLNDYGICVGTGSACSSGSDKPSHVALAYGLTENEAMECVRFTLSDSTTYDDIEYVVKVIELLLRLIR